MHDHSGSIGSFTLITISALAHTSAGFGTSVAPAARYASSANPEPRPAPCSTSTLCPSPTSDSAPAGTSATRCSAVLISFGTPTIMLAPRRSCVTSLCYVFVLRLCATSLFFPKPNHGLTLRIEEFGGDRRHLFFGKPRHRRQHLVQALIRLAVHRKTGQTIHPRGRTLQRQHQLALCLLLRLGERLPRKARTRKLGVLFTDRRRCLRGGLGLRADIDTGNAHLPVEAREGINRISEPQLLPDALEQTARHPAAEHVRQHEQGVLAPVGVTDRIGGEYNVGLRGVLGVAGLGPANCRENRNDGRRGTFRVARCAREPTLMAQLFEQLLVGEVACRRDDAIGREVRSPMQLLQVVGREGADRIACAED